MAKRKFQYTPRSGPMPKRARVDIRNIPRRNLFGTAARSGASAAVRALSRVHPYARMAYKGAKFAYTGYRLYRALRGKKSRAKAQRYVTTGHWGGKFKKVTRAGARTKFDKFNKVGVVHSTETIGSVSDQDVVYVLNEVINSRDVIKFIVAAVLRKLIEKAGIRVEGMDRSPFEQDGGSTNEITYNITILRQNQLTGSVTTTTKTVLVTDTFNDIVDFFKNIFEQYCAGYGELDNANLDELYKITLWTGVVADSTILSQMLFNEMFIDIYGTSQLKVQNRTKATGGSEDAENINNNPLQGWSYLFNGVPKPKANGRVTLGTNSATYAFERMVYPKGVSQFGGTTPGLGADFKEPPFPKQFWNVGKASNIRLEPGQMKSFQWNKSKSGNILRILKAIRLQLDGAGSYSTYSIFPVQMIALEDVINANAAETISVQFEVQRVLGVKCWSKEKRYFTTDYELRT